MSDQLDVRIITPEKVVFRNQVGSVVLPGTLGMMEILPDHVAMFSTIKPGEVELKRDGKKVIFDCISKELVAKKYKKFYSLQCSGYLDEKQLIGEFIAET